MKSTIKYKNFIQSLYFIIFNEHIFTRISRSRPQTSRQLVKLYGKKIWSEYPIFHSDLTESSLLFIHIPKCGGTSIANAFGHRHIRHFPACAFSLADYNLYSSCNTFAIVRDPIKRLISIISHFSSSIFSTEKEKQIFANLKVQHTNIEKLLISMLKHRSVRAKLFGGTNAGYSGFSVAQSEYIVYQNKLIVDNIFTLDNIGKLENWLSEYFQKQIVIGHKNVSSKKTLPKISSESIEKIRSLIPKDFIIYEAVKRAGGFIGKNDCSRKNVDDLLCSL